MMLDDRYMVMIVANGMCAGGVWLVLVHLGLVN